MTFWKILCVFAAILSNVRNKRYFVYGEKKSEEGPGRNFENGYKTKKDRTIHDLERALQYVSQVDKQFQNKSGCNEVAVLDILFDSTRWIKEAFLAVEIANLLTSLWRLKAFDGLSVIANETILYEIVRTNVHYSPSVFGSVVCFEPKLFRDYDRFCPYAFRDKKLEGSTHVVDLAINDDYDYSTSPNAAIWWKEIRDKTRNKKPANRKKVTDYYSTGKVNQSVQNSLVEYEDGLWTRPYFDCFGGKVWMVTYLAPFFNDTDEFLGTVSIDVSLKDVDINQCDAQGSTDSAGKPGTEQRKLNTFMGTHRCKMSTKCEPVPFQGFRRGSYHCTCKRGYYFPDPSATNKYFNGNVIEEEYDLMLRGDSNCYEYEFECRACSEGCEECVDDSACVYNDYTRLRYALLVVNCLAILAALVSSALVFKFWNNKIFKASSPRFLEIIIVGALMMYTRLLVSFFPPLDVHCLLIPWFHHVGFSLVYGSLALKTWRVVLIFRVRSAQKVSVTDKVLLRRLSAIVLLYLSYLTVWTVMQPPTVETSWTSDKLKYERCSRGWFSFMILAADFVLLAWGMSLGYKVRKAPQAYNESRFISYGIYNTVFVMCFINVLSGVLRNGTSPDVTYAMEFAYVHVTASVMLGLMFSQKVFLAYSMQKNYRRTTPRNMISITTTEGTLDEGPDAPTVERENEELKLEIKRLASRVALLQSQLMTEQNRHVKKTGSSRF